MFQQLVVLIIFAAALFYLGRMLYKMFTDKTGCATGCAKCNAVDFSKIETQIRAREL